MYETINFVNGMDMRNVENTNRRTYTQRWLLCEYSKAGAEMPHEVFHAIRWYRTATAAHNAKRRMAHPAAVVMYPGREAYA